MYVPDVLVCERIYCELCVPDVHVCGRLDCEMCVPDLLSVGCMFVNCVCLIYLSVGSYV
jgi:hypothetical protein